HTLLVGGKSEISPTDSPVVELKNGLVMLAPVEACIDLACARCRSDEHGESPIGRDLVEVAPERRTPKAREDAAPIGGAEDRLLLRSRSALPRASEYSVGRACQPRPPTAAAREALARIRHRTPTHAVATQRQQALSRDPARDARQAEVA